VIGQNPRLLKSGVQSATFYDAMWAALSAGLPWVADIVNRRKEGELYHLDAVISPIRGPDGAITGFVNVGRDVSHERELESAMASLMRERALIAETLDSFRLLAPDHEQNLESTADLFCCQVASLSNVVVAVLLALDSDSAAVPLAFVAPGGADVGLRRLPAESARELQERATVGPWVARTSAARGHPYLEGLQRAGVRAMAYAPVRSGNRLIGVLGIGSAQSDAMAQLSAQLGALVEFADLAGALLGHRVAERRHDLRLQHELEQIIAERAFWPVFQPIVDLRSRRIIGYEALTRFADGTRPDLRFDSAAEVGLGLELEQATLESAIDAAAALPPSRWAQFNVSPELVMADGILAPLLLRAGRRVVLEVTEHTAIPDYGMFRDALGGLGRRVYLAVDDAGAGFASLRHILELNPTFVKLDYSLVHGIDGDRARQALVAGMQHFARTSRRRLVAEGVETEAEAAILSDLGIRLAQGYLFGRPAALPD
jgi:EAL domain-containing protein (putative c-di-GMP-specific phosphodiesterase class I)